MATFGMICLFSIQLALLFLTGYGVVKLKDDDVTIVLIFAFLGQLGLLGHIYVAGCRALGAG